MADEIFASMSEAQEVIANAKRADIDTLIDKAHYAIFAGRNVDTSVWNASLPVIAKLKADLLNLLA